MSSLATYAYFERELIRKVSNLCQYGQYEIIALTLVEADMTTQFVEGLVPEYISPGDAREINSILCINEE